MRNYVPRNKRKGALTQATPGGSYDGKPAEDDPRFNPKKDGNRRSGPPKPRRTPSDPYRGRKRPAFNQEHWQNT